MANDTDTLPDTPAGARLGQLLALLDDGIADLTEADLSDWFSPGFLKAVPPESMLSNLQGLPATVGKLTVRRVRSEAPVALVADVSNPVAIPLRLTVNVDAESPHLITGLQLAPAPSPATGATPVPWSEVAELNAAGNTTISELDTDLDARLDELVRTGREECRIPGLAVGVVRDGKLVWFRGLGAADVANKTPITPDTVFRIGSVSKTMTAIGIMQLVEAGKLSIDDDVNQHLKAYRIDGLDGVPITIRHLLTHSSGLTPRPVEIGVDRGAPIPTLAEYYKDGLKGTNPVGHPHVYSNDAFASLGQVIEDVSGQPFEEYMVTHVFEPLGMSRSDYLLTDRVGAEPATGYDQDFDDVVPTKYRDIIVRGAGSVFSTVTDMAQYIAAINGGGANGKGRVLQPDTLEVMLAKQGELPEAMMGAGLQQGLGFLVWDLDGKRGAWHNGGWPGAATSTWAAPDDGWGVQLFANSFGGSVSEGLDRLGNRVMRAVLGVSDLKPPAAAGTDEASSEAPA